jgi:hypothetical protein
MPLTDSDNAERRLEHLRVASVTVHAHKSDHQRPQARDKREQLEEEDSLVLQVQYRRYTSGAAR